MEKTISFSELKRRITEGTVLERTHHGIPSARAGVEWYMPPTSPELTRVVKVQTNALAFEGNEKSKGKLRWLTWPKANEVKATDSGFTVWAEGRPLVTYRFI